MTILDKVVAAVTPMESDESRKEARRKAQAAAQNGSWLDMVIRHHEQIEAAFAGVKSAQTAVSRVIAQKKLARILTGHANAEESVLYPALVSIDEKRHATMAYSQQAEAKTDMSLLENLSPMTQEYEDKLEHIRVAVAHHVYEEEGTWFLQLAEKMPAPDQMELAQRYREEFERYVGGARGAAEADLTPSYVE